MCCLVWGWAWWRLSHSLWRLSLWQLGPVEALPLQGLGYSLGGQAQVGHLLGRRSLSNELLLYVWPLARASLWGVLLRKGLRGKRCGQAIPRAQYRGSSVSEPSTPSAWPFNTLLGISFLSCILSVLLPFPGSCFHPLTHESYLLEN